MRLAMNMPSNALSDNDCDDVFQGEPALVVNGNDRVTPTLPKNDKRDCRRRSLLRTRSSLFLMPAGAVERARLNFQGKKPEADETSSITQSEKSVDSNKDAEHEYEDDRNAAPFAMDPLEKQWMLQALRGNMVELRKLLNQDPNLAEKRDFMMGYTALHWAAKKGNLDLVKMFGDIGVDVNVKSNGGYTPLHLAAMQGHEKVVQVLVDEYEADTVIRDHTGKQARDYLRTGSISLPIQSKPGRSRKPSHRKPKETITLFESKNSYHLGQDAFKLPKVSRSTYEILTIPLAQRNRSTRPRNRGEPAGNAPVRRNSFTQDPSSIAGQISGWMTRRTSFRKSGKRDQNDKRSGAKISTGSLASNHSNDSDGGFEDYARNKSKGEGSTKKQAPEPTEKLKIPDYSAPVSSNWNMGVMWKPAGKKT